MRSPGCRGRDIVALLLVAHERNDALDYLMRATRFVGTLLVFEATGGRLGQASSGWRSGQGET